MIQSDYKKKMLRCLLIQRVVVFLVLCEYLNRLTKLKGKEQENKQETFSYDAVGNRTRMTMPDGTITNYTYDQNIRLTRILPAVGQGFDFAYNSLNRRTTLLYPNGMQTTYTYDAKGDLIDIITQKASSAYKQTYQYDKTGNRTSYTEPNATHTYTYDPTYQLVSADHTNIPDENYTYDQTGNRLNTTVDTANRLTEDANHTYTYDNNGNLIRKTHKITGIITQYTYDFENRLIKITLPLGITAEYKYDPFGRRIEKNISGQITIKYLYDNEDIITEYTNIIPTNTNITTKYIHGPGIDEPLSMTRNNKTYYYHADALGSITRMTDQNGNIAQTIKYDSFGNIKSISNPLLIQPYVWTGREYDLESGFYYLRNRYYDPRTGRFISKDPIGFGGGDVNFYVMVGNNAVNWVDPYGFQMGLPPGPMIDPGQVNPNNMTGMYGPAGSQDKEFINSFGKKTGELALELFKKYLKSRGKNPIEWPDIDLEKEKKRIEDEIEKRQTKPPEGCERR